MNFLLLEIAEKRASAIAFFSKILMTLAIKIEEEQNVRL
jgi:hypothetical protein